MVLQIIPSGGIRDNGANEDKAVGEAIPAERLARYGQLMLQMAEEKRVSEATKAAFTAGDIVIC
jgi:hypothetical protein